MKTLKESFITQINEYRTKKNPDGGTSAPSAETKERIKAEQDIKLKDVQGKDADEISDGAWGIDEPTDDELLKGIDKDTLNDNKRAILFKLRSKKPFFIQGRAGWGKTSIIVSCAHQCKRTVVTVYLDKAEATDLEGLPIPKQGKRGADYTGRLMPGWAKVMWDNPDRDFLLFFDEMNQATPDVMNALMPIVKDQIICGRKFKNFIVAGAGNLEEENEGGISALSKPLKSRFGGIIEWESGDWKDAFKHLHKKWDEKIGKDFVSTLEQNSDLFDNPRDVETHIIETVYELKDDEESRDIWTAKTWFKHLSNFCNEKLSATQTDNLKKLAEYLNKFVATGGGKLGGGNADELGGRRRKSGNDSKDLDMVPKEVKEAIKLAMRQGFLYDEDEHGHKAKWGISRENIYAVAEDEMNKEMVDRLVRKFEADGVKFRFEKNSEWRDAGYEDPEKD